MMQNCIKNCGFMVSYYVGKTAGMTNEMLDRAMLTKLLPLWCGQPIISNWRFYSFNYKFAMPISMFLQVYPFCSRTIFKSKSGRIIEICMPKWWNFILFVLVLFSWELCYSCQHFNHFYLVHTNAKKYCLKESLWCQFYY